MNKPETCGSNGPRMGRLRLGVDIGGTFTDLVIMNEETGAITIEKVPSTPSDPSLSFHAIILKGLAAAGGTPRDVGYLAHGTTVATNCIIEGKTARLRLAHHRRLPRHPRDRAQIKPEPFNLFFEKPRPLVPRHRALEARERLDPEGRVLESLLPTRCWRRRGRSPSRGSRRSRSVFFTRTSIPVTSSLPRRSWPESYPEFTSRFPRKCAPNSANIFAQAPRWSTRRSRQS